MASLFDAAAFWSYPYDPDALRRAQQAREQQQQMFSTQTTLGQPVFGSSFRVNPRGAPVFGPTQANPWQSSIYYYNPVSAVTQKLAEMGMTTQQSNPFVQFLGNIAEKISPLYDLLNPATGDSESQLAGFIPFVQQLPQLALSPFSALAGTQFSRRAVGQALRNFVPGEQWGDWTEQVALVRDILQSAGRLWFSPRWLQVALNDLGQKVDDYIRYLASTGGQAMSFIEFLVNTGFVDRYFGS